METNYVVINCCYGGFMLSQKAEDWLIQHGIPQKEISGLERHNKLLVQCVRELGEAASGFVSRLRVEEIEGNVYRIEEYDGKEQVITLEGQEWITIK